MMSLASLLLPVVLSSILVFITSSLIHMVLKYHTSDYRPLPNEDAVRAAIRSGNPTPAQYIIPYCSSMKEMESPQMKHKFAEGPVGVLNLRQPGAQGMGPSLVQWFVFSLIVSFFIAYIASHSIAPGTPYLAVFRIVGAIGFLAYSAGQIPAAIWMGKPWSIAWKEMLDGLLYGLVTAGTFGWLWPR
jgi:hypothetical protein